MFFLNEGVYHQECGGIKKTLQLQQCLWCLKFLLACNLSTVAFQTFCMHEEKNAIKLWKFTLVQLSAGRGLLWDTMLLVRCSRWLKKGWQVCRKCCTAVTTVSLLTHFCLPGHKKTFMIQRNDQNECNNAGTYPWMRQSSTQSVLLKKNWSCSQMLFSTWLKSGQLQHPYLPQDGATATSAKNDSCFSASETPNHVHKHREQHDDDRFTALFH